MKLNVRIADINNWRDLVGLSVDKSQLDYIESNALSIAESKFITAWVPVGIYDENSLIGFAMYGRLEDDRVWLDRFMIDSKYQGKGYGKASLDFLVNHLKNKYNCDELYLSIFEDNKMAIKLYKDFGFEFNGELDYGGEKVMVLKSN
ncbi:TPA: GNAT family N-acetyltransferase [Clostridioides difficile]|nr:GNAT family N-acetyltransferase [Clostridioides difficile]